LALMKKSSATASSSPTPSSATPSSASVALFIALFSLLY
jgi:hypothetical protein